LSSLQVVFKETIDASLGCHNTGTYLFTIHRVSLGIPNPIIKFIREQLNSMQQVQ